MIHTHPVESSMIVEIGHDSEARVLRVKFKKGPVWDYENVSMEEYEKLKNAESVGAHFHENIKKRFEGKRIS